MCLIQPEQQAFSNQIKHEIMPTYFKIFKVDDHVLWQVIVHHVAQGERGEALRGQQCSAIFHQTSRTAVQVYYPRMTAYTICQQANAVELEHRASV